MATRRHENEAQDNVVDMRLVKSTELRLQFMFSLTKEDELVFFGTAEEVDSYKTNIDIAYKFLGCNPQEVSDWLKVITPFTPQGYLKQGGKITKQGLIELIQYQWCCAKTVVARGEDWDVLQALGMTSGISAIQGKRDILKDARGRAVVIPNLHPTEFDDLIKGRPLSSEQIEGARDRVKINPYKVGYMRYLELLQLRWSEYQATSQAEVVIDLNDSAASYSGLATYDPSLNKGTRVNPYQGLEVEVHDLVPVEEISDTIHKFKKDISSFDDVVRQMKAKSFLQGNQDGIEIGRARYEGIKHGMEKVQESYSEMLED